MNARTEVITITDTPMGWSEVVELVAEHLAVGLPDACRPEWRVSVWLYTKPQAAFDAWLVEELREARHPATRARAGSPRYFITVGDAVGPLPTLRGLTAAQVGLEAQHRCSLLITDGPLLGLSLDVLAGAVAERVIAVVPAEGAALVDRPAAPSAWDRVHETTRPVHENGPHVHGVPQ